MHVARLEECLSKSELEPLENAIKEPRKFASDVVWSGLPLRCPALRPRCGATFSSRRNLCKVRARFVFIHVAVVMLVLVCLSSCKLVVSK